SGSLWLVPLTRPHLPHAQGSNSLSRIPIQTGDITTTNPEISQYSVVILDELVQADFGDVHRLNRVLPPLVFKELRTLNFGVRHQTIWTAPMAAFSFSSKRMSFQLPPVSRREDAWASLFADASLGLTIHLSSKPIQSRRKIIHHPKARLEE